jgi:hypothetical protein
MSNRIPKARPGPNVKGKFRQKREKSLKSDISGSSIRIGMKSPELTITTRPDGKRTTCFDLCGHHFEDTRPAPDPGPAALA